MIALIVLAIILHVFDKLNSIKELNNCNIQPARASVVKIAIIATSSLKYKFAVHQPSAVKKHETKVFQQVL
jgi:hypothetical protein